MTDISTVAAPAEPSRAEMLAEAYKRGILPPPMKADFEEAMKRGLVPQVKGPEPTLAEKFVATPVARGVSGTVGMPRAVHDLAAAGGDFIASKLPEAPPPQSRWLTGRGDMPFDAGRVFGALPTTREAHDAIQAQASKVGVNTDADAESAFGRVIQGALTGAVSSATMPIGGLWTSVLSGTMGGAGGEAAGEATKGTKVEPYARFGGALIAGGLPILAQAIMSPSAGRLVRDAVDGLTPQQAHQVEALLHDARTAGTPLTTLEAIQQVAGQNRQLGTLQSVTEANAPPNSPLNRMITERPAANDAAFDQAVSHIAPGTPDLHMIAPRVQAAAETSINNERQAINAQARPFYDASRPTMIPAPEFDALRTNPSFARALEEVRGNPELNAQIAHLPDNSVGVVDAVKKRLNAMAENVSIPATGQGDRNLAGLRTGAEAAARDAGVANSPMYAQALNIGEQGRQNVLEPLQRSALGKLAKSDDLVTQANAIMDPAATTLNPQQIRETVSRLRMHDPEATQNLVRRAIEIRFNELNQERVAGGNAFGAANFRAQIVGNREQAANLEALVRALPNGDAAWTGFSRLLDVFEAQGQRMPAGSNTTFNTMAQDALQRGNLSGPINVATRGPWRTLRDWSERSNFQRGTNQIAEAITSPDGLAALRQLSMANPNSERAAALAVRALGISDEQR